jgi:phosphoribosylamine---glycine ligase
MNILLVGGGGREHALAWKLAQSPSLTKLWAAPGNDGIAGHATCVALDVADHGATIAFCREQAIDLVVIGPEAPLVDGLADSLRGAGIATFGPSRAAAQLEGSKGFTKDLCARRGIPTAAYERHDDAASARAALDRFGTPVVVKADGLAAGKGVTVAMTRAEAESALAAIFAEAGAAVVIEAFLTGEEVSLFVLTDGTTIVPFGTAQDHKRVGDGDTGPNTGGMGAYSPAPILTPALQARALDEIVKPTVEAMAAAGTPFAGVLYAGLMLTADGPKLIEYNARLGDPETQVLMLRFEGDLVALLHAVATGKLGTVPLPCFAAGSAMTVVLAAPGYPEGPVTGGTLTGVEADAPEAPDALVFIAGARRDADGWRATGGRVLAVAAIGDDLGEARDRAYARMERIALPNGHFRRDIGWRALKPQRV